MPRSADAAVGEIDEEVDRDLDPFRDAVRLPCSIPGVSELTAQLIVSEIGIDMSRFPTAGHLISRAGLCPRNDESAGKRRSNRLPAQGRTQAENHTCPMCLGRNPQKGELSECPVPTPAPPPRAQEGNLYRRRLHPHRCLPHAARRNFLPRPRAGSLPAGFAEGLGTTSGQSDRQAWLRLHNHRSSPRGSSFCSSLARVVSEHSHARWPRSSGHRLSRSGGLAPNLRSPGCTAAAEVSHHSSEVRRAA